MGERQCYPVAGDISLGELAFAEPLAVGLHAVNRGGDLLGKSVLITGAGTIGCVTVLAARLAGARKITVTDVLDRPLAQAQLGRRRRHAARRPRRRRAGDAAVRRRLRSLGQLRRAQDLRRGDQARRRRRAGRHAAARAAAVRRQRADGEGARPARRVPLGHRVRLGGRLPVDAPRRRAAAAVGPVSVAGRRRGVRTPRRTRTRARRFRSSASSTALDRARHSPRIHNSTKEESCVCFRS